MPDLSTLLIFLAAALVIAVRRGPGIFYVAARSLAGGRGEGLASSFGTGLGGLVHVAAGALGVSAVLLASAEAFTVLKLIGALYLISLGVKLWRGAQPVAPLQVTGLGARRALRDGILVEALNPKTAAFFLAFLPQFVDPAAGGVALQFLLLGTLSVALNTAVDVVVVFSATALQGRLAAGGRLTRWLRRAAGTAICGLGLSLALSESPR